MPTVTSSRSSPLGDKRIPYAYYQTGAKVDGGVVAVNPWSQTTTSWRTGGQYLSEDSRYESMTGTELRSHIREEYARAYDTGHEFSTTKTWETQLTTSVAIEQHPATNGVEYRGPVIINTSTIDPTLTGPAPQSYVPSSTQIKLDGTKLWNAAVPTASEVSLAAFLGELKEGLPSLPGKSMKGKPPPNASAEEYLNWKFGVKPLKADLQNLAKGIVQFHKRVEQYRRDSGRNVRRRRSFGESRKEVELLTNATASGRWYIPLLFGTIDVTTTQFYNSVGRLSVADIIEQSTWFSGAYTYYLSEAHDFLGKLERYEQLANHALGTKFDLDTAWELTPWSWLVDWFSDAGTFISNLVAISNDNVVARYAYVMHHTKVTRMYSVTQLRYKTGVTGPESLLATKTFESKKRTAATPYGFGFNMSSLSATQVAILGALGITKSPGVPH